MRTEDQTHSSLAQMLRIVHKLCKVFETHWHSCVLGVWLGRQKTVFLVKEGPLLQE